MLDLYVYNGGIGWKMENMGNIELELNSILVEKKWMGMVFRLVNQG